MLRLRTTVARSTKRIQTRNRLKKIGRQNQTMCRFSTQVLSTRQKRTVKATMIKTVKIRGNRTWSRKNGFNRGNRATGYQTRHRENDEPSACINLPLPLIENTDVSMSQAPDPFVDSWQCRTILAARTDWFAFYVMQRTTIDCVTVCWHHHSAAILKNGKFPWNGLRNAVHTCDRPCGLHRSAAFLRNSNDLKRVTGSWGHGRPRIRVSVVSFATPGAATSRQLSTNICHFAAVCKYLSLCRCLQVFLTLQLIFVTLQLSANITFQPPANIYHFAAVFKYLSLCSCPQIFVTLQLQTSTLNPQLYRLEMGEMGAACFSAAQPTFGSGLSFPWPIRSWANLTGNFVAAKVTLSP